MESSYRETSVRVLVNSFGVRKHIEQGVTDSS